MITEEEKERALEVLRQYEIEAKHIIRDDVENDCPSQEYEPGTPKGDCEGDGHYMCKECVLYQKGKK